MTRRPVWIHDRREQGPDTEPRPVFQSANLIGIDGAPNKDAEIPWCHIRIGDDRRQRTRTSTRLHAWVSVLSSPRFVHGRQP